MKAIILILALAAPLVAQTNISQVNGDVRVTNVAAQIKAPELTSTEKFAISSIMEKQAKISEETKALNQAAQAVVADIAVTHPGYHLDANTMQLVKDAPKEVKK